MFNLLFNFYPRSPCGERPHPIGVLITVIEFLSTLSLRRATSWPRGMIPLSLYFYPRSPCGERRAQRRYRRRCRHFYPRSPCGERPFNQSSAKSTPEISIHALLAESDKSTSGILRFYPTFLSTLSLRRATILLNLALHQGGYFYPRSPCGERRDVIAVMTEAQSISIHALLAESDGLSYFYIIKITISIHALLAESDVDPPTG